MSASQTFVYCYECKELGYGISDKNGVYQRDDASSNHWDHDVHVFGVPDTYQPPIRQVLTKLAAGLEISDLEMAMFKLAIALGELEEERRIYPRKKTRQQVMEI